MTDDKLTLKQVREVTEAMKVRDDPRDLLACVHPDLETEVRNSGLPFVSLDMAAGPDQTTYFVWMPEEQTASALATLTDENRSLRAHLATAREKAAKDSTALYAELLVLKDSCDAAHETIRQLHASLLAQAEQLTARDASIAGLNAANLQLVQRLSVANNTIAAKDGRIAELDTRLARR